MNFEKGNLRVEGGERLTEPPIEPRRLSHVQLSVTLWTVARQAVQSMGIHQARLLKRVVATPFSISENAYSLNPHWLIKPHRTWGGKQEKALCSLQLHSPPPTSNNFEYVLRKMRPRSSVTTTLVPTGEAK